MKNLIKFRRTNRPKEFQDGIEIQRWEIAKNEKELFDKLDGTIAEIIMPAKPFYIRWWRKLFPLKFISKQINKN